MHEWLKLGLREIDKGVIEAARSMGAKTSTIIWKVLIPESLPALVSGITVTAISLVGFTAMAGVIGAGGLGNLAFLDGFPAQSFRCNLNGNDYHFDYCVYHPIYWRYYNKQNR